MELGFQFLSHTGKCIRRFGGIYMYCRYFIDRKRWILVLKGIATLIISMLNQKELYEP